MLLLHKYVPSTDTKIRLKDTLISSRSKLKNTRVPTFTIWVIQINSISEHIWQNAITKNPEILDTPLLS